MKTRVHTFDIGTLESSQKEADLPVLTETEGAVITQEIQRQQANSDNLRDQADKAITSLRAYRDLATPTNAQTVAAVKLLCRVAIALIRLQLSKFDAAD